MVKVKISFVIPAYNEETMIARCVESVLREVKAANANAEIVVVNNASTDRTKEIAQSFKDVRVVDEPRKGLTFARQAGFAASSGELIANIDADTHLTHGWIQTAEQAFLSDKRLVAFSGPFIYDQLSFLERVSVNIFYTAGYLIYLFLHDVLGKGAMLQGGNFVIRRSAIESIGGFDTSIAFYGEDTDMARRLSKVGKVVWTWKLPMHASPRRLQAEGMLTIGCRYALNFFWVAFRKQPYTTDYTDIRIP
jgi:glycosyltransferase involved in cell wall biosynthesis